MSSFAEEVTPIEIPTYLLKKKKLKPINPLETNCKEKKNENLNKMFMIKSERIIL